MIIAVDTESCPKCGAELRNNGHRNGRQQFYCLGTITHYHREALDSENQVTYNMEDKKAKTISVEQFRQQFDNHYKVEQAVKKLPRGELILHRDFKDSLNLQGSPSSELFEAEEFEPYCGKASGGKVFWSHPDTIKSLKGDAQRLLK